MKLPGTSHLAALKRVKAAFEAASVVVISSGEDPTLNMQAIEAGVAGYIPKNTNAAVTARALRLVPAHGIYVPSHALRGPVRVPVRAQPGASPPRTGCHPSMADAGRRGGAPGLV